MIKQLDHALEALGAISAFKYLTIPGPDLKWGAMGILPGEVVKDVLLPAGLG